MSLWKHYLLPNSLADALHALAASPGIVRIIAGGTDLLLDLQQGRQEPADTLVDISRIPELTCLDMRAEGLFIGAGVPLDVIIASPLVRKHAFALYEACSLIGGPQVRNIATLGGNVAHALPAGDGSIALLALGVQVEIATPAGKRLIPIEDIYLGPGKSALAGKVEIIVGFHLLHSQAGEASAFMRVMRPQGVALPVLNTAIWLQRKEERIADIRIAIGPAGPKPFRARLTESSLRGQSFTTQMIESAKAQLLREARFRTSSHRATSAYRMELSRSLMEDCLTVAWQRAEQT
jgi:CO/xanthine dehydrogenase FAD-binding subunit